MWKLTTAEQNALRDAVKNMAEVVDWLMDTVAPPAPDFIREHLMVMKESVRRSYQD